MTGIISGDQSAGPSSVSSNISQAISHVVKDQLRRKRNVVVSGLPGSNDVDDALHSLCENIFTVNHEETKCRRIGSAAGTSPRCLLITLASD